MTEMVNLAQSTVLKAGDAFCVSGRDGGLPLGGDHPLGLYLDDCRYLSGYQLRAAGQPLRLLHASAAPGTGGVFELTNPDLTLPGRRRLPLQSLRVRVERHMRPDGMVDLVTLRSHTREPIEFDVELEFDADFRPMLEIRGFASTTPRAIRRQAAGDGLRFSAIGIDGRERSTTVTCPGASPAEERRLRALVGLDPGEARVLEVSVVLATEGETPASKTPRLVPASDASSVSRAGAEADAWLADRPRVDVDDDLFDRVLRRSLLDLRLLASNLDGHRYFAAGVPWYATLFGRDSIITALQTLAFDPTTAEETLRLLAGHLGSRVDDEHDEEPGKVIHELRQGELAARNATPLARYYGTVDATPLFLCLLCEHADWTGSLDLFHELRPQIELALQWLDEFGDLDGDGLLEYRCRSSAGLVNQGWKDSWDGIVDEHGVPLRAPIALVEVQGYALRARRRLARLFELDGDTDRALRLRADADRTAAALERFWLADRGCYAMALDADKRPTRALGSNQGHLLWSVAVPIERAAAIRDALTNGDAYSGWGVRTLSANERAFNPVGYHTGTVWPHDNALFAAGLRNYGFDAAFLRVFEDLLDAAASFPSYRLPELFAGFSRADYEDPVPYPVACSPQAWAAGALPCMLIAGLGLVPDALRRTLRIRRPSLPRHIGRLALQGLRLGDARIDLLFERVAARSDSVALTDVQIDGDIDVVLEIGPVADREHAPSLRQVDQTVATGV